MARLGSAIPIPSIETGLKCLGKGERDTETLETSLIKSKH